ncbi:MAG: hypothetical protein ACXACU_06445 [Candidatus Hodarchaeales archaeon]
MRRKKKADIELMQEKMGELDGKLTEQFEQGLKDLRAHIEERVTAIENQIESTASRLSELSQILENRSVEIRTSVAKEFKHQLDEMRTNLETLGIETNNEILDLSRRFEKLDQNSSNWSFAVNEQMDTFRTQYVNILEELRQSAAIAVEKEKIMTQKYTELVEQLKEKERLALDKENLNQKRLGSLQDEVERKEKDSDKYKSRLEQLEDVLKEKMQIIEELEKKKHEAEDLKRKYKKLKDDNDIQTYELERIQSQLKTMATDTRKSFGTNKAIKAFLSESESGRILNQLLNLDQVTTDELSAMTGIATFTVVQIIQHFRDLGIIQYDDSTRRARLIDR